MQLLGPGKFRGLVIAGALLALATVSDSFIYLILQRRLQFGSTGFPLLYVGTFLVAALFSIPCGRLADRFGRGKMFLGGYAMLALVYGTLLLPIGGGVFLILPVVLALGMFYAATDGVLAAMAAAALPASHVGSGLAVLATATSLARLGASVLFGFLWTRIGLGGATAAYLATLAPAIVCAWFVLNRHNKHVG
jgi:MFS family permease